MTTPPLTLPLEEFVTIAHGLAMDYKTRDLAEGIGQMPFVVTAFRGSTHVVSMFAKNRDEMLWCIGLGVGGFGADRVAATLDAYSISGEFDPRRDRREQVNRVRINPDTGKDFEPGDMQRAFEAGRPWVTEHLATFALDKVSGEILGMACDYKVTGTQVAFQEMRGPEALDAMAGLVPDALRQMVGTPDIAFELGERAAKEGITFGLTETQKRAHTDAVLLRVLEAAEVPALYTTEDEEVRDIISMSMERADFEDGSRN